MAYNFKSIADAEVVEKPSSSANVLIEENGVIKKAPKTAVGGAGGEYDLVIVHDKGHDKEPYIEYGSYQNVYNKIMVEQVEPRILAKICASYYEYGYSIRTSFNSVEILVDMEDENNHWLTIDYSSCTGNGGQFIVRPDGTVEWQ